MESEYSTSHRGEITRLYARAVKQRWAGVEKLKPMALAHIKSVLDNADVGVREKNQAVKILVDIEKQNQSDEHKLVDRFYIERIAELDQIAAELGIDPSVVECIASKAAQNTGETS